MKVSVPVLSALMAVGACALNVNMLVKKNLPPTAISVEQVTSSAAGPPPPEDASTPLYEGVTSPSVHASHPAHGQPAGTPVAGGHVEYPSSLTTSTTTVTSRVTVVQSETPAAGTPVYPAPPADASKVPTPFVPLAVPVEYGPGPGPVGPAGTDAAVQTGYPAPPPPPSDAYPVPGTPQTSGTPGTPGTEGYPVATASPSETPVGPVYPVPSEATEAVVPVYYPPTNETVYVNNATTPEESSILATSEYPEATEQPSIYSPATAGSARVATVAAALAVVIPAVVINVL